MSFVYQNSVVHRPRIGCFFKCFSASHTKWIGRTKTIFGGQKIQVFKIVRSTKDIIHTGAFSAARCTPCMKDVQVVPVRFLAGLFNIKCVDQLPQLPFQRASVKGDSNFPLGMLCVQVCCFQCQHHSFTGSGKTADSLYALHGLDYCSTLLVV